MESSDFGAVSRLFWPEAHGSNSLPPNNQSSASPRPSFDCKLPNLSQLLSSVRKAHGFEKQIIEKNFGQDLDVGAIGSLSKVTPAAAPISDSALDFLVPMPAPASYQEPPVFASNASKLTRALLSPPSLHLTSQQNPLSYSSAPVSQTLTDTAPTVPTPAREQSLELSYESLMSGSSPGHPIPLLAQAQTSFIDPTPQRKRVTKARAKRFLCPHENCGKRYTRPGELQRHQRTHSGEKPFACEYEGCGRSFVDMPLLRRHQRIHQGDRPHPCSYCDRTFASKYHAARHERVHIK